MIFFGTSSFSLHALDKLLELGIKPECIITVPDKPQGRAMVITPPPAKVWAERHNVPILQFEKLDAAAVTELKKLNPDIFLIASYGKIIPQDVLDIPNRGAINIHPSLLPKYRGATPLHSAILADDKDTGVTLMLMDAKMDHGPILAARTLAELPGPALKWPPTLGELEYVLACEGASLAADYILNCGDFSLTPQDDTKATFTKKITKEDGLVSVEELEGDAGWKSYLKYCALEGWPGIYFFTENKKNGKKTRVSVKSAKWNDESKRLELLRVTPEGKKEMAWKEFVNYISV